jgi:hypothetical protein
VAFDSFVLISRVSTATALLNPRFPSEPFRASPSLPRRALRCWAYPPHPFLPRQGEPYIATRRLACLAFAEPLPAQRRLSCHCPRLRCQRIDTSPHLPCRSWPCVAHPLPASPILRRLSIRNDATSPASPKQAMQRSAIHRPPFLPSPSMPGHARPIIAAPPQGVPLLPPQCTRCRSGACLSCAAASSPRLTSHAVPLLPIQAHPFASALRLANPTAPASHVCTGACFVLGTRARTLCTARNTGCNSARCP